MKRLIIVLIFILPAITWAAPKPSDGIRFDTGTWKEIVAKAKKEKKYIFIDCYTSWCGPCKRLSSEIFPQKEIGDFFNEHFINYKVDMEKGEGIDLSKQFHVGVYPTLLWVEPNGNIVHRVVGFMKAEKLLVEAGNAFKGGTYKADLEKNFKNNPKDPQVVKSYLDYLANTGDSREGEVANQYLELLPEEKYLDQDVYRLISKHVRTPFSPAVIYIYEHRSMFDAKFNKAQVDQLLNETYSRFANKLVNQVRKGQQFDEKEFLRLTNLMETRHFSLKDQVEDDTRIAVLHYRKDWKAYASLVNEVLAKRKFENINSITFRNWYTPVVASDCRNNEVLESVLRWIDMAFGKDSSFSMTHFKQYQMAKISLYERMDGKAEEMDEARKELLFLSELENKQKAYNTAREEKIRILTDQMNRR